MTEQDKIISGDSKCVVQPSPVVYSVFIPWADFEDMSGEGYVEDQFFKYLRGG